MNTFSPLQEIYRNWLEFHNQLVGIVMPLSHEQLQVAAAPNQRAAWLITAHIVAARVYWLNHMCGIGGSQFAPLRTWDDEGQPARSGRELAQALDATWQLIHDAVHQWTAGDLTEPLLRTRQGKEFHFTRMWVIWHLIEHDIYHGGELSLTLGAHGITGMDL